MFEIKRNFFVFVFNVLKLLMLNATNQAGIVEKLIMYANCCFTFSIVIFESSYIIQAPDGSLNAIKCLGALSFRILSIARLLHYIIANDKYIDIWKRLERTSFNFEHFYFETLKYTRIKSIREEYDYKNNYENLKKYWQTMKLINVKDDDRQKKITKIFEGTSQKYIRICYGAFVFMMGGTTLSLLSSYLLVLIKPVTLIYDADLQRNVTLNELPYRLLIPYVDFNDPLQYKLVMWYEAYCISYLSFLFISVDMILEGFMLHLAAQINIINEMLQLIDVNELNFNERITNAQLVNCIEELQEVTLIQENIENTFNIPLLIHYTFCSLIMVTCVITIHLEKDPGQLSGTLLFALLAVLQPLMNSTIANLLHDQFERIPTSIYNINWYNGTRSIKQKIIYALFRYQKSINVSVGKFIPLNLTFYTAYMQKLYSIYALLNTVNQQN